MGIQELVRLDNCFYQLKNDDPMKFLTSMGLTQAHPNYTYVYGLWHMITELDIQQSALGYYLINF